MKGTARNNTLPLVFLAGLFIAGVATACWLETYYLAAVPFAVLFFLAGWQRVNMVFFILLLTLPFSAEVQVTATLGTDFPDELMMLLTAGIFICYVIYSPGAMTKEMYGHPLIFLLLVTFSWSVAASLFSTYPLLSLKFLLAKCWYIGAFVLAPLVVFREKKNMRVAFVLFAIAMLVAVTVIMLRHSAYRFSFAGINEALKPFFRNHVNYSAMLVCMIPVFVAVYKLTPSKMVRYALIAVIVFLSAALFLSYSRGAWLALFTGGIAGWLIKKRLMVAAYIAFILLVAGAIYWLQSGDRYMKYAHNYRSTIFHKDFREHLRATYEFRDMSTAERFYRWIAGARMIKERPLSGFGPSAFYDNYKPYAIPAFKTWVSHNPEHSTVHNYFLLITIEQGIPGLLFFILLAGVMFYYAQKLYHRARDPFYKTAAITAGAVLSMILTVNFLSDLIETDKIGSLFFLCLSLLVVTDINTRRESLP